MHRRGLSRRLGALAATTTLCACAHAQVSEATTAIVFNSRNPESAAIRAWYVEAHPGVREFDLDFEYPHFGVSATLPAEPDAVGVNNKFMTRARFDELFLDPSSRFRAFLAENPQINCLATTRGLPVSVSDNFHPLPYTFPPSTQGSLEAWLSRIDFPEDIRARIPNPYFGAVNRDFSRVEHPGMLLVSRLDCFAAGSEQAMNAVRVLIQTSGQLRVNKFEALVLLDADAMPSRNYLWQSDSLPGMPATSELAEASVLLGGYERFHVVVDRTNEFLNGPDDPAFQSSRDGGVWAGRTLLVLKSLGRNHTSALEPIPHDYVRGMRPGLGSLFVPLESYSAWSLHDQDNGAGQGQCGDWIARGGSFSAGFTDEPYSVAGLPQVPLAALGLYVHGRPWAEAAYASIAELGKYTVLLGDPLARVKMIDPDVDRDRAVTAQDLALVEAAQATQDLKRDIDGDGVVSPLDVDEVVRMLGRANHRDPDDEPYWPVRADTNYDLAIDGSDLARLLSLWGASGAKVRPVDLNKDGHVDAADLAILLSEWAGDLRDVDRDGSVTDLDKQLILDHIGGVFGRQGYMRAADVNSDGVIGFEDWSLLWQ